jgi:PEP-CTERM motif
LNDALNSCLRKIKLAPKGLKMSNMPRLAMLALFTSFMAPITPAFAVDRPAVEAAQLSYNVQASGRSSVFANNIVFNNSVALADGNWTFRTDGSPRPLISFDDLATTDQDLREDGTNFGAHLIYHFRLNAASQAAFDAALQSGFLSFDGFTDIFETNGIQTLSGLANVSLSSQYNPNRPQTLVFAQQVECNTGNTDGCGRHDFSATPSLAAFADADTLSFAGTVSMFADYYAPRVGEAGAVRSMRIDPVIGLIGNGLVQSDYNFEFSSGIGNGALAAVPEPESWAMMIAGFGMVGFGMRRRSNRAHLADEASAGVRWKLPALSISR